MRMQLQHVNVKIPVEGDLTVDAERFIELFHRWIREQTLDGLLIDVADYRHVPSGPGVMLIGFDYDVSLDHAGGEWGLLYNRKSPLEGTNEERLRDAFKMAHRVCDLLEMEFAGDSLKFSRLTCEIIINDRALAPNTEETWQAARPELESFLQSVTVGPCEVERDPDPRRRFALKVKASQPFKT